MEFAQQSLIVALRGGTCGPVVAARLAEGEPNSKILLIEAGKDSAEMDTMHMAGAYVFGDVVVVGRVVADLCMMPSVGL